MIKIDGTDFKDDHGRTVILRGVNLDAKVPFSPDGSTHIREGFFDHRNVSFVGRTFPLAEVDEHFRRLKHWGLTFFRFLVPWEAIEHGGPGIYDEDYLDYLYKIVSKAGEYGMLLGSGIAQEGHYQSGTWLPFHANNQQSREVGICPGWLLF